MDVEDKAEELASDLGVDKEEVKEDLENLVSYSVPLEEAVGSLRRKYGEGGSGGNDAPPERDVAEITTADDGVTVGGVVLTVGKRSIQYQGTEEVIFEGEFADETGKISYTAWNDFGIEPGDIVRIENAGIREWEGDPELNLGERTTIAVSDEDLDIPYEIGGDRALAELAAGDRGVNVTVQVLECERKLIEGRDGETEILSGVVGDESTRLPFTDWEPHDAIEERASVRIEDAFVREFRGAPSINVSEFSTVTALDRAVGVTEEAPRMTIQEAVESGGLFDVAVVGSAIAVRDGSGLIERCPECGRVVQNGQCRSHGAVEGEDDLRTKVIIDDGTATVTAVLDEDLTADVYGGGLEDAREHARDAMDREVVTDAIREAIVGKEFQIRGSLSVDDYGATLNATAFDACEDDPADRARELLAEVGR
ncbi:Single-stranded DNA binding protein [Halorhabdus rudnickae]|uniref:Single-stranded DNA binding protein n=1 Tax=Halorhabdus rudnickae TaxID=1775544 RepID=UPI0010835846|nr:Single-stranded DNA binding protein [Halorhabdus rudnickae]